MDSYNSKYPLEYYSIGTPYLFYISHGGIQYGKAATMEQIKKYGKILKKDVPQDNSKVVNDAPSYQSAVRCIGVVVDKISSKSSSFIEVMFLGDTDGKQVYLTKKYIVAHSSGVFFDDKENSTVHPSINVSNDVQIDFSQQTKRSGGITISPTSKVSGGITLSNRNQQISSGITLSRKK